MISRRLHQSWLIWGTQPDVESNILKRMKVYLGMGLLHCGITAAYQEDPLLNAKAQQMKAIAACINKAIIEKDLMINDDGTIEFSDYLNLEI